MGQAASAAATASCSLQAVPSAIAVWHLRAHRAVSLFNKAASYRYGDFEAAELMLVGIAVRKTCEARCCFSLPAHREDEGELIDRAWGDRVPERARKLEGSEC